MGPNDNMPNNAKQTIPTATCNRNSQNKLNPNANLPLHTGETPAFDNMQRTEALGLSLETTREGGPLVHYQSVVGKYCLSVGRTDAPDISRWDVARWWTRPHRL